MLCSPLKHIFDLSWPNIRGFKKSNCDEKIKFSHFNRHTTPVWEISRYLQKKRAWDTKESKINPKIIQLIDVPSRIQLTYTSSRHPSVIVELSNISPPWPVPEREKEKGVSIKTYLVTNLLVGPHCFLFPIVFHNFPLVYRKFGLTLYCSLSSRVSPEVLIDYRLIIYLCCN